MKFPRIEVGYNIVFNNTGFDWTDIQNALCEIIERKYRVLHSITTKYHEENNIGAVRYEIKGVWCLLYFKVNTDNLNKVNISLKGTTGGNTKCHCPNCHSMVSHGKYCSNCGQALKWRDSE